MRMVALSLVVLGALAAFLPAAAFTQTDTDPLVGTQWQLVSMGEWPALTPALEGVAVTLAFGEDGRVSGSGGCNQYGATYTRQGGSIAFGSVISTKMACMDSMEQEQYYFMLLRMAAVYGVDGDQLTLTASDGQQLVFILDLPLAGTEWQLVAYGVPDALTPALTTTRVTLSFDQDNRLGGTGGCNQYGGSYTARAGALNVGEVVSTLMACMDASVSDQEIMYLQMLGTVERYEIADDQLTLTTTIGQQLVFSRVLGLIGREWRLTAFGPLRAEAPVLADSVVTLNFGDDRRLFGSGGCNQYGGEYSATSDRLAVGTVISTEMACEGLLEQELAYFAALGAAEAYVVSDEQLIITTSDGQALLFSAVESL